MTAILVLTALWGLGRLPVDQVKQEVLDTRTKLASLVQVLELPTLTPPPTGRAVAAVRTLTPTAPVPAAARTTQAVTITLPLSSPTLAVISQTVTVGATSTTTPGTRPVEGEYYAVRAGDTLLGIAARLGISWQLLAKTNNLTGEAVLQIGQKLRLPVPTPSPTRTPAMKPTAGETPSPTFAAPTGRSSGTATSSSTATTATSAARVATATPAASAKSKPTTPTTVSSTYVVQAGDSLATIGALFGVPWETIAAANKIANVAGLQIGQRLIIPLSGPAQGGAPTLTVRPRPTVTPTPAPPTPAPTLLAPVLDRPADGSRADGDRAQIELGWLPVPDMPAGAQYQITIDWVEGGQKNSHSWTTTATAQRMPPWLWGHADPPGRWYTWYVTVVQVGTDGKGGETVAPLSPPSASRALEWQ